MIDSLRATAGPWRDAMVSVTFVLDGHEAIVTDGAGPRPPRAVDRVMLLAARKHIQRRLSDLLCERHGESPHVIASGPSADRLQFSVEGCCDTLVEMATRALGNNPA
jgi:hypothetical protein